MSVSAVLCLQQIYLKRVLMILLSRAMFMPCCLLHAAQRCVSNVTRCSFLLVDRLAAELPHMSRAEIEEHEDW